MMMHEKFCVSSHWIKHSKDLPTCAHQTRVLYTHKEYPVIITLSESVLMDKDVFFLLDDEDPHLLFRDAGCPSEFGVLGTDVPENTNTSSINYGK